MTLEVLRAVGRGSPRNVDIVLVHGIFVGAWIWAETFLPYLADAGFNVHAVSLSGHGKSCGRERLDTLTLADFTADLMEVTREIDRPVAAVGHSMGGAVVQNAVTSGTRFAGAALLASVPPSGLMAANVAMMWSDPPLWRELARMYTAGVDRIDLDVLRQGLFSDRVDRATFARFAARCGGESAVVGLELQGMRPFAPPPLFAPPMLVMGGSADRLIRREDLWATGAWYGVTPHVLDGLSHTLMLDPDWERAAECLVDWLDGIA